MADPKAHQIQIIKDYRNYNGMLEADGFVPHGRSDATAVRFSVPFDWAADPLRDRNWMFQLHAWRMLDGYLNAIDKKDDAEQALGRVLDIIRDWHRANVAQGPGAWSWYDMATGIRASKLAFIESVMNESGQVATSDDVLAELVTLHLEKLMDPLSFAKNNHGLFQLWGLKSLAAACPDHPLSEPAACYAVDAMTDLIDLQMGQYGVHTENSPDYHFFAINRIKEILDTAEWQIPEMDLARRKLEKSECAKGWLVDSKGTIVTVGDSGAGRPNMQKVPPLTDWPHIKHAGTLAGIVDGYAVVRSERTTPLEDSSFLFLTASFQSKAHKHADCLSFVWQEKGEDILIDSGKYGYNKDPLRAYVLSVHAHNTVEVNQKNYNRREQDAYGSGIKTVRPLDDGWLIDATAPHLADGYTHHRTLLYRPGRQVFVFDRLVPQSATQSNDFTVWWHFPSGTSLETAGEHRCLTGLRKLGPMAINWFSNAQDTGANVACGQTEHRYQGWVSTGYLKAQPAPALGLSGRAKGAFVSATVLTLPCARIGAGASALDDLPDCVDQLDWPEPHRDMLRDAIGSPAARC